MKWGRTILLQVGNAVRIPRFAREYQPGFWEVRSYSKTANPSVETRFDVDGGNAIYD